MGGLFAKPKTPKPVPPPPPPPPPEPVPTTEVVTETGEEAVKRARRRSGYAKTILAGSLEPSPTGKRKVLG